MENTSFVALSRLGTLRRQINVIANNLANMNTTGFKGEKMMFVDHVVRSRGGTQIMGDRIAYVRDIATVKNFNEGAFQETGNPLDVAIHGDGFFVVETPNGERYTRNGSFRLDDAGQLVNKDGDPVLSDGGQPFFFTAQDRNIEISSDGTVSTEAGPLGRLAVVRFENPYSLESTAGGQFTSEELPVPAEEFSIVQNMLEGSNVNPIIEMTRMIEVHRRYKSVQRMVSSENDRMKQMIKDLGSPG
ncbi:MAG: flagellar basal-body rod protein FlgF [Rhodospirillales bacterium]|nr:flagellar basal-body rod protein FlgF [Rhodospirillales bacterium]